VVNESKEREVQEIQDLCDNSQMTNEETTINNEKEMLESEENSGIHSNLSKVDLFRIF